ncbi:MAG: hypothetical protein BA872_04385 [Desulfobacterales bacterium C00003060]|nr:MAG: hypothetical protein BA872_04385 [Desulfobacterales bacterium C00003060]
MSIWGNTDNEVPGGVYLCQVHEHISCGACCGLYNVADPSLEALREVLAYRTRAFALVPREIDPILGFKERVEARESRKRPFADFHHCPFLGLVGMGHSRVGCLLHPLADGNKGIDFRGLSFYGGMACRVYFCPSYYHLSTVHKEIVREAARDWYVYGLVITESKMLSTFFQEVERRLNKPITKGGILDNKKCLEAVREFLELKLHWPFRAETFTGLGNYFFGDQLYSKPPIDYEALGETTSACDIILQELVSDFGSVNELREAENILYGLIDKVVSASFTTSQK